MPQYEFEITHTVTLARTVTVRAADEEAAIKQIEEDIGNSKHELKEINVDAPDGWESDSETEYAGPL